MNLRTKKSLAAKALKVGKDRIIFLASRIADIKEAITKQDIRDLNSDGAIAVKEIKGRKKNEGRKNKKGTGKIKKKVKTRKQDYVKMVRKQRKYTKEIEARGEISKEDVKDIRKKIRNKQFKSKANLRDYMRSLSQ